MSKKPQVEVSGWEARYYDFFINLISLGRYKYFLRRVIEELQLPSQGIVMDLGAGTGRMAELMLNRLDQNSRFYALEIGKEMIDHLTKLHQRDPRLIIIQQRIEEPFHLPEPIDLALISFVLHGLQQAQRIKVIENVYTNLRTGGKFCILDYNSFAIDQSPWYIRFAIRQLECESTEDFIVRDWPTLLTERGFSHFHIRYHFNNYIRLLCSVKT